MSDRAADRCRRGVALVTLAGATNFTWSDPGTLNGNNLSGTNTQIELEYIPNFVRYQRTNAVGTAGEVFINPTVKGGTVTPVNVGDTGQILIVGDIDWE